MTSEQIYTIAILAIAVFIISKFLRPKYPIRIVTKDGRVQSHQGIAKAQVSRVVDFLERDVRFNTNVTIFGVRDPQGVLRVHFKGRVDQGTAQQIRNFLKMTL
jgi:hypothetical protein